MSKRSKSAPKPTHTSLVMGALTAHDGDFATIADIMRATGSNYNQVNAALHHLRNKQAVDVVIEPDGTGWWFATPEYDTRQYVCEERTPEDAPRRPRRPSRRIKKVSS